MKAIILAAGKGTRVRPLTYNVPKPMIPIINQPVMELLVDHLGRHQVSQIMVNTSYMATEIENYFRDGARFGVEMAYSFEGHIEDQRIIDEPVGSAGAIKKIQEHSAFFDETFVVLCGDAIIDIDLTRLLAFHRSRRALATIALAEVGRDQVSSYGVVVTGEDGRVSQFQEKPRVEEALSTSVNTGIYIFEPEIIDRIPSGVSYDIGGELFPSLVASRAPLYGHTIPFQWLDIGQVSDYYAVMQMVLRGEASNVAIPGAEISSGIRAGLNVRVDLAQCDITPPVYIGGSSTIEAGATIIGPTMIGAGCVIEAGARVERSVIFDYTRVGSLASVNNMMICGGYCVDERGAVVDLARSDVGWAIADARSLKQPVSYEQENLLAMLREW